MIKYAIRRMLWSIPVLFMVALFTFVMVRQIPGGPFDFAGDKSLPASVVANLEAKYHLNDPLPVQFADYLLDLVQGDLGPSFRYRGRTVNDIIGESLPVSFQLGLMALGLAMLIGIPAGIIAALKQNTVYDYTATGVAILGVSLNSIVLAPVLIWIFAVNLKVLPAARWGAQPPFFLGILPPINSTFFEHAILPVIALGLVSSAGIARLTRASLLQVIREDYIRTARAKGLKERAVVIRHALKNSLIPVVTILGPLFAAVLTGTFVIEQIFGIPGMGRHFIQSVGNRDYPIVMGTTLVFGVAIVMANLGVDLVYAWLDPRIRLE